jgi:tail-anchored protein insertion receptor
MTLLFTVFLVVFFTELISWIGKSVLLELVHLFGWLHRLGLTETGQAYAVYLRIFYSGLSKRQRALKSELLTTKAELLKTSAQDQFAKWAKLRRSVDKGIAELEGLRMFIDAAHSAETEGITCSDGQLSSARTSFSLKFNSFLWFCTTGLEFFIGWWYRKAAVFYLPAGWFGPVGWWLALPFAPKGREK